MVVVVEAVVAVVGEEGTDDEVLILDGEDGADDDVDGSVIWIDDLADDAAAAMMTFDPPAVVRTDNHPP